MIQVLPVMQQDAVPTKPKASALPGKPAAVDGLPGLFNGADDLEGVADFLEELAELLGQGEQPEPSAGPENEVPESRELAVQEGALEARRHVLDREQASQPILPEQWLQGMRGQQAAVIAARAGASQERGGMGREHAGAADAESVLHLPPAPGAGARLPQSVIADNGITLLADTEAPLPAAHQASAATAAELATAMPVAGGPVQAGANQAADSVIRLQAPEARWGEQMLHALRQHVELNLQQGTQQAHIRLDPPELGSLDIHLSHESGRLHVQIGAGQADVARLLHQTSERLRQELMEQNFPQVEVHVFSDSGQQQRQPREQAHWLNEDVPLPAAARKTAAQRHAGAQGQADDVLVTV